MIEVFSGLHLIKDQGEVQELVEKGKKENFHVVAPTHLIKKGGEIAGYVSIAGLPLTICHFDPKLMQAEDTFSVINIVENLLQLTSRPSGVLTLVFPAGKEEFTKAITNKKVGYRFIESVDLHMKRF